MTMQVEIHTRNDLREIVKQELEKALKPVYKEIDKVRRIRYRQEESKKIEEDINIK